MVFIADALHEIMVTKEYERFKEIKIKPEIGKISGCSVFDILEFPATNLYINNDNTVNIDTYTPSGDAVGHEIDVSEKDIIINIDRDRTILNNYFISIEYL